MPFDNTPCPTKKKRKNKKEKDAHLK